MGSRSIGTFRTTGLVRSIDRFVTRSARCRPLSVSFVRAHVAPASRGFVAWGLELAERVVSRRPLRQSAGYPAGRRAGLARANSGSVCRQALGRRGMGGAARELCAQIRRHLDVCGRHDNGARGRHGASAVRQDSRCVYSFTYLHSKSGTMAGGSVAAGAVEERCAPQAGVELRFRKWTRSAGSAR
jgi:hypothetical protein